MDVPSSSKIAAELKALLAEDLFLLLEQAGEFCHRRGERLFIAGGMVRDLLLGLPSKDIDLVVEGDSRALAHEIARLCQAEITLHERFQTAKLSTDGFTLDIATARKETYDHPGVLPVITAGTMEDDLNRRDFSINAMAISISGDTYAVLIDPLGGFSDLDAGVIRILHSESFADDPTRIFRAIRYEQRFGFEIEPYTLKMLMDGKQHMPALSPDRLRYEFECIFNEQTPESALNRAYRLSVLRMVSEHLVFDWTSAEWFKAARKACAPEPPAHSLYLALMMGRLAEADIKHLAVSLNLPADQSRVVYDVSRIRQQLERLAGPGLSPSGICHILDVFNPLAVEACAIMSHDQVVKKRLKLYLTELCRIKPALGGDDLINLGFSRGPEIGSTLQKIRDARLDGAVSTREQEIEMAKTLLAR